MNDSIKRGGGSRILKHRGGFHWEGVPRTEYKPDAAHWSGVSRTELVCEPAAPSLPFHVRYFEIAPGGRSSCERHEHEHVVMIVRGSGTVRLGDSSNGVGEGDVVHIRSWELHQFSADGGETLGFYCIVAADRDAPVVEEGATGACEWKAP